MAGKTALVTSYLNARFVHVPVSVIAQGGNRLELDGELWRAELSSTGQPEQFSEFPHQL